MSKRALGRGIDALLSGDSAAAGVSVTTVPIDSLKGGEDQPRRRFPEESLAELARSIEQKGVLQPILVEPGEEGGFTIVAGERRFRAARRAGLKEVPVIVGRFTEVERTEIALVENLQREDLTPVEEALGYKALIEKGKLTQEEVARRVGKDRSTVTNSLRLLKLPAEILEALDRRELSAGHARALLSLPDPEEQRRLFRRVLERGLSVRETEEAAGQQPLSGRTARPPKPGPAGRVRSPLLADLEQRLIEKLGTKVTLRGSERRGRIEISYFSPEDLERLLELIAGEK